MKKLYIVFSSTPYMFGRIIRLLTGEKYNHTAIYVDRDTAYCFGRFHENVLLQGGLVRDSASRYVYHGKTADICLCGIELEDEKFESICNTMNSMYAHKDEYVYNIVSALSALRHKRIYVDKSFTCVEYSIEIVSQIDSRISRDKFYTVEAFRKKFIDNIEYEGVFNLDMIEDTAYKTKTGLKDKIKFSIKGVSDSLKRV